VQAASVVSQDHENEFLLSDSRE